LGQPTYIIGNPQQEYSESTTNCYIDNMINGCNVKSLHCREHGEEGRHYSDTTQPRDRSAMHFEVSR
jgi:hypothetical protein